MQMTSPKNSQPYEDITFMPANKLKQEPESKTPQESPLVIFGEVLYDCFPQGRQVLGGAPFNVAWGLQGFGHRPLLISSVGADPKGDEIRTRLEGWGLRTDQLHRDSKHATGMVEIQIKDDEPKYDISMPSAWDYIPDDGIKATEMLYHGSLALRNERSLESFRAIAQRSVGKRFFDINLRPPYDSMPLVREWMQGADWVKLNVDELRVMLNDDAVEFTQAVSKAHAFRKQNNIANILLTGGSEGAQIIGEVGELMLTPAPTPDPFVDTVGAGDAFTAYTIHGILNGMAIDDILRKASDFAAKVCGLQGATTESIHFYQI